MSSCLQKSITMFGNLMGDMEARKAEMNEKLSQITVEAQAGDGAVRIQANANRQILNVSIDKSKLASEEPEELEDLLLTAINRALALAQEKEATEAQNMIQDILPPGLGDMFGGM